MSLEITDLKVGDPYNWKNQPERLVYVGKNGVWHQFAKIEKPNAVWCEVLWCDLHKLEKHQAPIKKHL